jgi:hypothetical protein
VKSISRSILGAGVSRTYRTPFGGPGVTIERHEPDVITVTWCGHWYCSTYDRNVAAERIRAARIACRRWEITTGCARGKGRPIPADRDHWSLRSLATQTLDRIFGEHESKI